MHPMPVTLRSTPFLRLALRGDAATNGATGPLLAAAATSLAPVLGLPEALPRGAGLVLLDFGRVAPTALGTAFVLAQAAVALGFAAAQWMTLRRARTAAPIALA
jgi:hypothetical protein